MSTHVTTGAQGEQRAADQAAASRQLIERSWNDGDFAMMDELVARDAVDHDPAMPAELRELRGPQLFKTVIAMYRSAFPDLRFVVDDTIASGDKVVLRWHAEGTHRGPMQGLAPTGARGTVTGISIDRWQDGRIVESWTQWDNLGLARQLGAAPAEGSLGERAGVLVQRLVARRMRKRAEG
jgi:steroid delta-isomerase-like uncharacterized protein